MNNQFEKYALDDAKKEAFVIQAKAKKNAKNENPNNSDYWIANNIVDEENRLFQGEKTSLAFHGEGPSKTIQELYGESAKYFSDIIRTKILDKATEHTLIDFGCHRGELLSDVLNQLKDYHFHTIGVDTDINLQENNIVQEKIPANLTNIPLGNGTVECGVMRYVLQWNNLENQKKILQEISRVVDNFVIVQHAGADNTNPVDWRIKFDEMFNGEEVKKLKRNGCFFSSKEEVEKMLEESEINFEVLSTKQIEKVSNVFIEKFALSEQEAETVKRILNDKDYIVQTTWLLKSNKEENKK